MNRRLFSCIAMASSVLFVCLANAPLDAHCQSQAETAPTVDTSAPKVKAAKVWTNDNIAEVHSAHTVSVVGPVPAVKKVNAAVKSKADSAANRTDIQNYRKQLATLRADVEKLDDQIQNTKAFLNGESVAGSAPSWRNQAGNPADQLTQFQVKRQSDLAKIADVLDLARQKGIEPGALR